MKRRSRLFLWLVAFMVGAVETWANRHAMNPDGVSYLDMGDAYFRGDWGTAINAYWSPLYSWLLGGAMFLINPAPRWEYPLAHLVNFFVYLCALVCFDFFLREVIRGQRARRDGDEGEGPNPSASPRMLLLLGYAIFIWASFVLIRPAYVTPDMCVAALVYLAAGLVLRIRRDARPHLFALLGLVLGFSYLAKAPMFLVSFLFIAVAAALAGGTRRAWPRLLLALGCYALVAAPFVAALSLSKGRLTFGDSGKLAYAWLVNDVPLRHWQGGEAAHGAPVHPTRQVLASPAIYEFGAPIKATYALWYDPSYWYEGVAVHFNLRKQLRVIAHHAGVYLSWFSFRGALLVVGFALLFFFRGYGGRLAKGVLRQWCLLFPALAALGMYSLVHVEGRFVAPFMVLILVGVISGIGMPAEPKSRRLTTLAVCVILLISIGPAMLRRHFASVRQMAGDDVARNEYWRVAQTLKGLGVKERDEVASLDYANPYNAKWARLARVRIVAEMYDAGDVNSFWANSSDRERVMDAFRRAGAKLVVASNVPKTVSADGWRQLEGTDTYVYFLSEGSSLALPQSQPPVK
ncbi:MAG TPA: hypothetical protein VEX60_02270 [Pyrinomonadaceae bacterium]|nr:hypothetical protein [Pyrinomonadaceae bacterium]